MFVHIDAYADTYPAPLLVPPVEPAGPLGRSDTALLAIADPSADSRVAVFVPGAIDLVCALLRRGVTELSLVRADCPHRAVQADIAVIPEVRSASALRASIACARGILVPLGTIVIRLNHSDDALGTTAQHTLLLHGFSRVQRRVADDDTIVCAELPLHGRFAC